MLKVRSEQVINVSHWDELVVETYKRPYRFQQQDGCKECQRVRITIPDEEYDFENDTVPEVVNGKEMGVSFEAWLQRDPKQLLPEDKDTWSLGLFWERNFYPDVQMIANDLHTRGLVEAGNYVIDIGW